MTQASPRPWMVSLDIDYLILSRDKSAVAVTDKVGFDPDNGDKANAMLIVKCVNNHDALVSALEQCQKTLSVLVNAEEVERTSNHTAWARCVVTELKARKLLEELKG